MTHHHFHNILLVTQVSPIQDGGLHKGVNVGCLGSLRATLEAGYHTPMTLRAELQIGIFPTEHGLLSCRCFLPSLITKASQRQWLPTLTLPLIAGAT